MPQPADLPSWAQQTNQSSQSQYVPGGDNLCAPIPNGNATQQREQPTVKTSMSPTDREAMLQIIKNINASIDKIEELARLLPPAINVANAFLYGPLILFAVAFVLATIGAIAGHHAL